MAEQEPMLFLYTCTLFGTNMFGTLFGTYVYGYTHIYIYGCGYMDMRTDTLWIYGYMDIWILGYLDICIFGCVYIYIYIYINIYICMHELIPSLGGCVAAAYAALEVS